MAMSAIGQALLYTKGAWREPAFASASTFFTSVSCVTSSFCVAGAVGGDVFSYVVTKGSGVWHRVADLRRGTAP